MEGQRVHIINPSREKHNASANHSELPANTEVESKETPAKSPRNPSLPGQNKRVVKAKPKQQGQGEESPPPPSPPKKKGGSTIRTAAPQTQA